MPRDITKSPHEAETFLRTYLRDHRGGAATGLALLRQCRRSNEASPFGIALAELEEAIDDDRRALERIMDALGVKPSRLKRFAGWVTPYFGHLKRNNRPFGPYSPLTRVLELETLAAGILTKHHLWRSLEAVATTDVRLDRADLERLAQLADAQRARVTDLQRDAARLAFTAT